MKQFCQSIHLLPQQMLHQMKRLFRSGQCATYDQSILADMGWDWFYLEHFVTVIHKNQGLLLLMQWLHFSRIFEIL